MKAILSPLPWWGRALLWLGAGALVFLLGQIRGERISGEKRIADIQAQAAQTVRIGVAQAKVVIQTEIQYRDKIQKIYVQGETIEKEVVRYVTSADDDRCSINAGFVRSYNASWAGEPAGSAADSDRGPAGVPLSGVGEVDAHNAKVCLAWREQALGWREFYRKQQIAIAKGEAPK